MKKILLPVFLLVLAIACSKKSAPVTPVDLSKVADRFPGYTLEQYQSGKSLYEQYCGSCHTLKKPGACSEEKWARIVPPMVSKVNKEAGAEVLNTDKKELILRYLITARSNS